MTIAAPKIETDEDEGEDVLTKIRAGKYRATLPWGIEKPVIDTENLTGRQVREAKEAYEAERKKARDAHRAEENRLRDLFQRDLAEEFGLTGHPKESKLYELAYQHGHSEGYEGVYWAYSEWSELLDK